MKPDAACFEGPRDAARFTTAVLSARCSSTGEALAEIRLKASHRIECMIVDVCLQCDAEAESKDESMGDFMVPSQSINISNNWMASELYTQETMSRSAYWISQSKRCLKPLLGVHLNQSLSFRIPPGAVSASGRSCGDRRASPELFPARYELSNGGELRLSWGIAKNNTKDVNPSLKDIWRVVLCFFDRTRVNISIKVH
jgi:hypothetical protein